MMRTAIELKTHDLGNGLLFYEGRLPDDLIWNPPMFQKVWDQHPKEKHLIMMHGHLVETPRWQQAHGADYHYTGRVNKALPIPPELEPLNTWVKEAIYPRLNGILINYYESSGHYIGPHRDSTKNMVEGAPIVTVSFGETRMFRMTLFKHVIVEGKKNRAVDRQIDFPATNGTVFVEPYATNKVWYHSVPKKASYTGRRISVTFRAFDVKEANGALAETA